MGLVDEKGSTSFTVVTIISYDLLNAFNISLRFKALDQLWTLAFFSGMSGVTLGLCIGSDLGLEFCRERPFRVLSPCFADPKIHKETNYFNLYLSLCQNIFESIS